MEVIIVKAVEEAHRLYALCIAIPFHYSTCLLTLALPSPRQDENTPFCPNTVRSHFVHSYIIVQVEHPNTDHTVYKVGHLHICIAVQASYCSWEGGSALMINRGDIDTYVRIG